MMRRLSILIIVFTFVAVDLNAQDDNEYKMEIGGGIGLVSYEGDFNGNITKDAQPMASIIARRIINPRMALKMNVTFGKLKGSSKDVDTYYADYKDNPIDFNKSLVDVGVGYEYNFWPYGTGNEYRGAHKLTPYITLGLGVTSVSGDGNSAFTANIPLGAGVKYKVAPRVNIALEWAVHFSFSDKLDGVEDPYGIKSTGIFKNKDCYSMLQLMLTYDIMSKCKTCNKDDD